MKQWAIKTPEGKLRVDTSDASQKWAWINFSYFPDRKAVWFDYGSIAEFIKKCKARGYICVPVEIRECVV